MGTTEVKQTMGNMEGHICSHRHVHLIDNFLRPLIHNPRKLFSPYVKPGMTAMDVGCGKGFATLGLAELVSETGRVIAVDLQPEMLAMVKKRVIALGFSDRVRFHQCRQDQVEVEENLDFVLTFWMAHETPDLEKFLREIYSQLNLYGHYYLVEPKFHVSIKAFKRVLRLLEEIGFSITDRPKVRFSRAVVLKKANSD